MFLDPFIVILLQLLERLEQLYEYLESVDALVFHPEIVQVLDGDFDFQIAQFWLVEVEVAANFLAELDCLTLAHSL